MPVLVVTNTKLSWAHIRHKYCVFVVTSTAGNFPKIWLKYLVASHLQILKHNLELRSVACQPSHQTVVQPPPPPSPPTECQVKNMWSKQVMSHMVFTTWTHLNMSVICRNVNWQHFIQALGLRPRTWDSVKDFRAKPGSPLMQWLYKNEAFNS